MRESLNVEIAEIQKAIEGRQHELAGLKGLYTGLEDEIAQLKAAKQTEIDDLESHKARANDIIEKARISEEERAAFDSKNAQLETLTADAKKAIEDFQNKKNELDVLGKALNNKNAELKRREDTIREAEKKIADQ